MNWIIFIILTVIIMIIGWIGNTIADSISNSIRNKDVQHINKTKPEKDELLSDRFKK